MNGFIYKITNKVNNKIYIGKTLKKDLKNIVKMRYHIAVVEDRHYTIRLLSRR